MQSQSTLRRRFVQARRTSNVTNDQSAIELRAGVGKSLVIWRIKIELAAATASAFELGVPAARGVTPTAPEELILMTKVNALEPATAQARTAIAWATSPTPPTKFVERVALPATIGAYREIFFTEGFSVANGSSFVVQNDGATGVADITFEISE
jgi:hypothetical protein